MEKKSNSKKYLLGTSLALLLTLGIGGALIGTHNTGGDNVVVDGDLNIVDKGVSIRMLSKETNSHGQETITLSYSVTPDNATNQNVIVTLAYKGGGDCSSVMTASVNSSAHTIALECKGAFNKQIVATVTSEANSNAKGEITIDYEKKLLGFEVNDEDVEIGTTAGSSGATFKQSLNLTDIYTPNYSVFTKDKTYNYTYALAPATSGSSLSIDENLVYDNDVFEQKLTQLLESKIKTGVISFTDDELWNLDSSNEYHSALRNAWTDYVSFDTRIRVSSGEKYVDVEFMIYVGFYGRSYTGKTVGVDSITVETGNLTF